MPENHIRSSVDTNTGGEAGPTTAPEQAEADVSVRVSRAKTRVRFDRPGHLAEAHAARLLEMSRGRTGRDEFTLVFKSAAFDDLATELAEQAVTSMVGGGDTWLDTVNAPVEEEEGGPFLETAAPAERRAQRAGTTDEDKAPEPSRDLSSTPNASNPVRFEGVRRGRKA